MPQEVTHLKSKTSRSKEVHPFVAGNLQSNTFRGFQEKETASSRAVHVLLVHFWGEHVNRDKFCLTVFVFYLTKKHTLCLIFSAFVLLSLPLPVSLSFYVSLYLFCICICTFNFNVLCVFFFLQIDRTEDCTLSFLSCVCFSLSQHPRAPSMHFWKWELDTR